MQWLALSHIKSSDVGRRLQAIESLSHSSDVKALVAIIGALSDPVVRVRVAAAQAIGASRDERCVQPLFSALRDPNARVREAAAASLKTIGHPSAIPYLLPLLSDVASSVQAHAAHALQSLQWKPQSDEQRVLFFIAAGMFSRAAEVGAIAVEPLIAMLADDVSSKRRAVTEALGEIKDPRAIDALTRMLDDSDSGVRVAALSALGRTRDATHAPAVLKQLQHGDKNVRGCALEALTRLGHPDLFPILVEMLSDPHWNVRTVAATALGATGDPRALEPLTRALSEADGDVRQVVAEAIGRLGDPNAIELLILAHLDRDSGVRQATLAALTHISPDWARTESAQRSLPALKHAVKDPDYSVRQTAADLLNRIFNIRQCEPTLVADVDAEAMRRHRAVDVLASILWDDDPILRFAGVWALHQIGDPRAAGPLSTRLKDSEGFIRQEAERALVRFGVTEHSRSGKGHALQTSDSWGNGPVA